MAQVTLLDSNILLYSSSVKAPQHEPIKAWLKQLFEGPETVGLPWLTLWAFIRLSTNIRVWPNPKSPREASATVRDWLNLPGVILLHPGPRHIDLLEGLIVDHSIVGPKVTDAALAALAIENGATLASTDRDFRRFKGLRWVNPLD
ncbi:MAG TPA: TA system VapC family ribonuclease toxin [Bryobacteraceae bacterium]|jgi:hypothetical protein|nr:TA system VapC family ribonuclease toxin [Bryobacteraceae bacterium]